MNIDDSQQNKEMKINEGLESSSMIICSNAQTDNTAYLSGAVKLAHRQGGEKNAARASAVEICLPVQYVY